MGLLGNRAHGTVNDVLKALINDDPLGNSDIWMLPMLTLMLFSEWVVLSRYPRLWLMNSTHSQLPRSIERSVHIIPPPSSSSLDLPD